MATTTTKPPKKVDQLRAIMAAGDWRAAISMAVKFPRNGEQTEAIQRAHESYSRPDFQRQLKRDPDALIAAGIAALKVRYGG